MNKCDYSSIISLKYDGRGWKTFSRGVMFHPDWNLGLHAKPLWAMRKGVRWRDLNEEDWNRNTPALKLLLGSEPGRIRACLHKRVGCSLSPGRRRRKSRIPGEGSQRRQGPGELLGSFEAGPGEAAGWILDRDLRTAGTRLPLLHRAGGRRGIQRSGKPHILRWGQRRERDRDSRTGIDVLSAAGCSSRRCA